MDGRGAGRDRLAPGLAAALAGLAAREVAPGPAMAALAPADVLGAADRIAAAAGLWHGRRHADLALLDRRPDWAGMFLFHCDGFVRQAALVRWDGPLATPGMVVALALRLNDWVPQVRAAAELAAARLLPISPAAAVVPALVALVPQALRWGQWRDAGAALAPGRVAGPLADHLAAAPTGPMARIMVWALRHGALEAELPRLARTAVHPAVRARAWDILLRGEVRWVTGTTLAWLDKSMGQSRLVPRLDARPVPRPAPLAALIAEAAGDRAVAVRWVAAAAIEAAHRDLDDVGALVARLGADPNGRVRARISWVARQIAAAPAPGGSAVADR